MVKRRLNWKRDKKDNRDFRMAAPLAVVALPPAVDLSPKMVPCFDQGDEGSCTAHGWASLIVWQQLLDIAKGLQDAWDFTKGMWTMPSRNFIYFNERRVEGTTHTDDGAQIRDGVVALSKWGICSENTWPYEDSNMLTVPSAAAYQEALKHMGWVSFRINQNELALKQNIAAGFPVVFGTDLDQTFMSDDVANTGIAPNVDPNNINLAGGHCMAIFGYDDTKVIGTTRGAFKVRNSWGIGWGLRGYVWMSYEMICSSLASDFWTVRKQ